MTFWQGRKVLVTGHTGFKGSWISLWLQLLGADLVGFALKPQTTPNLFDLANVAEGMTSIIGDIRDYAAILNVFKVHQPEIVIHMAAQPLVRQSYKEPTDTYAINVMGTVHVLEAARQTDSVKTIINVTTDKCYENFEWSWGYRENDRLGGHDPYSNSKACAELVSSAYRSSYFTSSGVGLATARAGNVIGGGDWADDRLVPDILRAMTTNATLMVRNPMAARPWQHVLEPLSGYLLLAEHLTQQPQDYAGAWNFGPALDDAQSVSWIVDKLSHHCQQTVTCIQAPGVQLHEAQLLSLDSTKAYKQLSWKTKWSLDQALSAIASWHNAWSQGKNMRDVTLGQILHFSSTV